MQIEPGQPLHPGFWHDIHGRVLAVGERWPKRLVRGRGDEDRAHPMRRCEQPRDDQPPFDDEEPVRRQPAMVTDVAKRFETNVIDVVQDQGGHTKIVAATANYFRLNRRLAPRLPPSSSTA